MQVSVDKISQAIAKVRKFADGTKNVPGIMLDISGELMKVCYSDGKKSIIEKIDIQQDEPAIEGKIVVPYARITSVIDACQPSGPVYTSDLSICCENDNCLELSAVKKIKMQGKAEGEVEEKVVSKFAQKISYAKPESSVQYGILSRMDYESIFQGDKFDVWDIAEFKGVLAKTSKEKNRVVYISSSRKSAFISNLAHFTNIPVTSCDTSGMTIATNIGTALVDIVSKMNGSKISICTKDNRYCNIISEDEKVGVWFEMAPASKIDVATLERYESKQYTKYNLVFCKPALQNVIASAMSVDNNEKTIMSFEQMVNGEVAIRISSNNGSVDNSFNVILEDYKDRDNDMLGSKVPVGLAVLYSMIDNCEQPYISMDISVDDGGTYIKISDITSAELTNTGERVYTYGITHYTISAK